MVLADEHIAEFQALWKKRYGTEITKAQTLEKALRLIRLLEAVSRAIANDNENKSQRNTQAQEL